MPGLKAGDQSGLIGRAAELGAIERLLRRTRDECEPTAAVVLGDPGIGKTRLITEVANVADGLRVFRMAGFEPEQRVPLGAAAPVLRELAKSDQSLAKLLTERPHDVDTDGIDSIRIFESAYRALLSSGPVMLLTDDVQWLDELSVALVHYLVRAACADRVGLMALCAARPAPQALRLARSLSDLFEHDTAFLEVSVEPLTQPQGVELARMFAPDLNDAEAANLWATSGGSPFWIQTAARAQAVPDRPAAVIASSLRALSPNAASALAALVVAARPVATDELSAALGWPADRVTESLTELVNRGLASVMAERWRTAHDLVRDAALGQMPPARVTDLHAKYADTLRRRANGDLQLLMEALEHADAAGVASLDLALEIARLPQRRLLGLAGLTRLSDIANRPSTDTASVRALELELAYLSGELSDHVQSCDRWSGLAVTLPTGAERATAAMKAAKNALEVGRSEQIKSMCERARREPGADEWIAVAADALDYSRLVWLEHDRTTARPFLDRAVSRSRELVAAAGSVDVLSGVARQAYVEALDAERVSKLMDDDIVGMLRVADEITDASRGMGERHVDSKLFANMALRFLNRWPEAERRTKEAVREAERHVYPGLVAYGVYELALGAYMQGRVAEAAELYDQARRLGARVETSMEVMDTWLASLGPGIEASRTDWRRAVKELREQEEGEANPHLRLMTRLRIAMCLARYAPQESRAETVELLGGADADAVAADCPRCLWELRLCSVELYARVGELERAQSLLDDWDVSHRDPHPRAAYMRQRSGAVVHAVAREPDAAELFREAASAATAAGLHLDHVWSLIDLGDVLIESERDLAVEAWTSAAAVAGELGAATEEGLIRRRLREAGVRRMPAPAGSARTGPAALSRREVEVARLAIAGARNADIAQTLFISAKTVEQHLSRIFAKLDVRNRTELGARFSAGLTPASDSAATPGTEN